MNILIAEPEKKIRDVIKLYLLNDGYIIFEADTHLEAINEVRDNNINLVIIADKLKDGYGIELCKELRKEFFAPIIYISEINDELDVITALGIGCDDYIVKPIRGLEFSARVKALIRRDTRFSHYKRNRYGKDLKIGKLRMNKEVHTAFIGDEKLKLTPREFEILYLLLSNPNIVYKSEEIFNLLWEEKSYEVNNTVMVHIKRIRSKISKIDSNLKPIKTIWGVGYKLDEGGCF